MQFFIYMKGAMNDRICFRRDIFLQGSIKNLPEFKEEGGNYKNYRESQISIPTAVLKHDDVVDGPLPLGLLGDDEDYYEEPAPFLCGAPAAIRSVFAEMVSLLETILVQFESCDNFFDFSQHGK